MDSWFRSGCDLLTPRNVCANNSPSTPRKRTRPPVARLARLPNNRSVHRESVGAARREAEPRCSTASNRPPSDPGISAVFCAAYHMALGLLRALRQAGRRVPEDVSIIGLDDIPEAEYFGPPLTTARQGFDELGRRALRSLIQPIDADLTGLIRVRRQTTHDHAISIRKAHGYCPGTPRQSQQGTDKRGPRVRSARQIPRKVWL
ncbi:substrate-binding domain-containing protein [Actinocrinis puniceicyclus]|uniref:substrate-binding domain-containing protein n=1 Tax=Actinocrinis puniceicyclus TaxID=977794 RepID=UPI0028B1B280|nr:substrate-binding domain-containing protein [Actinocrinis puniceicyclus]